MTHPSCAGRGGRPWVVQAAVARADTPCVSSCPPPRLVWRSRVAWAPFLVALEEWDQIPPPPASADVRPEGRLKLLETTG